MIPESIKTAVNAWDVDTVRSWLAAGGERFVYESWAEDGLDDDSDGGVDESTLLGLATRSSYRLSSSSICQLLLEAGARPKVGFLINAISGGQVEIARLLLSHGVDVNNYHGMWTALHFAADSPGAWHGRQTELVRALLDAGASVDARKKAPSPKSGCTPLLLAAQQDFTSPDTLKVLLKYGADVNAVDALGRTADDHVRDLISESTCVYDSHGRSTWRHSRATLRDPILAEGALALFRDYRAAGGKWKRYVAAPRKQLLLLRKLVERGRARPPQALGKAPTDLFVRKDLPDVLFWLILSFWRSSRDL